MIFKGFGVFSAHCEATTARWVLGGTDSMARQVQQDKDKREGRKGVRHGHGGVRQKSVEGGSSWACVVVCSLGVVAKEAWAKWWQLEWVEMAGGVGQWQVALCGGCSK